MSSTSVYVDTLISSESVLDLEREVHQKSAIGMELYGRGILSKPKDIELSNTKSVDIGCGISISLPQKEANNDSISIETAYTPYGPGPTELFPEELFIVSPIVWVCSTPEECFSEPATIKLPHCFDCKTQEDADLLGIVKADHNDVSVNGAGQLVIKFKKVNSKQVRFFPNEKYGILQDHHFCLYCTIMKNYSDEDLQRVNYCLSILKPPVYPVDQPQKIHCILHYDLEGCHKVFSIHMHL